MSLSGAGSGSQGHQLPVSGQSWRLLADRRRRVMGTTPSGSRRRFVARAAGEGRDGAEAGGEEPSLSRVLNIRYGVGVGRPGGGLMGYWHDSAVACR